MIYVNSEDKMKQLGQRLGTLLKGGEVIELIGDVGAGKTTFVKGLATGLAIDEDIQSPSFTISRTYPARDGLFLAHYDFYRLTDAGIMADELNETVSRSDTITIIEWAGVVADVLPTEHISLTIIPTDETSRSVSITAVGTAYQAIEDAIQ